MSIIRERFERVISELPIKCTLDELPFIGNGKRDYTSTLKSDQVHPSIINECIYLYIERKMAASLKQDALQDIDTSPSVAS